MNQTTTPRWLEEFGAGYDCPPCPEGFGDESWHNDTMPCYRRWLGEAGDSACVEIWMDHPEVDERVICEGPRYIVQARNEDSEPLGEFLECDDFQEALAFAQKIYESAKGGA